MNPKTRIKADIFRPVKDNVFVTHLDSGPHKTPGGILLPDDNMTERGIHQRWGKVWRIGPEVEGITVGDWVLVEHGRWTNEIEMELTEGVIRTWRIDWPAGVLLACDTDPRENATTELPQVNYIQSELDLVRSVAPAILRHH
jgi:co-chaperonin GroES (HSP10)